MIIGLFIRNYKIYDQLYFIPLSNSEGFTGIIGENGVGKTTILQVLDTYFNKTPWQKNIKEMNDSAETTFIEAVFLVPKERIAPELKEAATEVDAYLRRLLKREPQNGADNQKEAPHLRYFRNFMDSFLRTFSAHDAYLLTAGVNINGEAQHSIFPSLPIAGEQWLSFFRNQYRYLYIPTLPEPSLIFGDLASPDEALLDSGEKLELIVDGLKGILQLGADKTHIVGFDEPDASLQTAACYDLFEKIYKLMASNVQILVTSHWYGFIPLLTSGLLIDIVRQDKRTYFLRFDISRYREEIKIRKRVFMEKYHEELPIDVELKSVNDFIQSVLGGVINKPYYNWLICEGSSEKIYFNYYFDELIKNHNLRIVPVGGVREVKKIYTYLAIPYADLKEYIHGKVVLLTDTDTQLLEFDTHAIPNLHCFRIVNHRDKTELVQIKSNPKSPATEIEDALNGKVFHEALLYFKKLYPKLLDFVTEDARPEIASYYALDFSPSQQAKLTAFFDHNHQIKTRFAEKYIEICKSGNYRTPPWINELKNIFANKLLVLAERKEGN